MKIYHTSSCSEFTQLASEFSEERIIIHVTKTPCVWTGQLPTLNREECEKRGIEIGQGEYLGGSIVNMPRDLSLCIVTWGGSDLAPQIVDHAAEWLYAKEINVRRDENDVLADGKKVISWARVTLISGWCQSVVHFSIGEMDLELVKAICTKPMVKVPGALSEYGVTAEELWTVIKPIIERM